jgi:tetratricopeptide (TPR) repeat protein
VNANLQSPGTAKPVRPEDALASFEAVLATQPDQLYILGKKAHLLHQMGRREEALSTAHRAVSFAPTEPSAFNLRGMILDSLDRCDEARADFERALAIQPDFADAINNRGILYARAGYFEEALACYERSLSIAPTQPQTLYNRAMARLALGDWARGFREFESRWSIFPLEAARLNRLAPVWLGQWEVSDKTVLLHHEQGYGDTLQFARYAPLVARLGARVIVAVPNALRKLAQTLPGQPQIVSEGEAIPAHDYCCSLMSLPLAFGTTVHNVPAHIPYLRADPQAVHGWHERLGDRSRLRVGLVWSGRRYPPINYPRDMPLEVLKPLLTVDAEFVCLQTELSQSERTVLDSLPNVTRYGESLKDFADTAALIENLDLTITVDTAVAHLAGALGKPVWLMNRYASCWRWLQERMDSPWYPTLRIFRQASLGDWVGVVREVRRATEELIAQHDAHRRRARDHATSVETIADSALTTELQCALNEHRQGQLTMAIAGYRRVLALYPNQPEALHYLGIALSQQGQYEEALKLLSLVLRSNPQNATAHNHYGNALVGLLRHEEALASYEHAIALNDAFAQAHYNRGAALTQLGRPESALASYARAIELDPAYAEAHNNLGNVLSDLARCAEALRCYDQALQLRPEFVDAWVNRANLLRRLIRYEDALASSERAIRCSPTHAQAHSSHGAVLASVGRYEEAMSSYRRAIELEPTLADAIWNMSIVHLSRGEFREGWPRYEARWHVKNLGLRQRHSSRRAWAGEESLQGQVILLHAEQGYGDIIQFSRYAPLVAARGARVMLGVPGQLRNLMRSLEGVEDVIAQGPLPAFEHHCPLLSLPLAFGTELATIPAPISYLRADGAARARWRARLGELPEPRVGLVWSGRATHSNDLNRSVALEQFLPFTRCGAQCVSLQKEVRAVDERTLASTPSIERLGEELTDFADTAGLLSELDLVISVDTAIAHLAGALGKPVWILLPQVADWRWLQEREDSPWYPSAKLFRQPAAGDWASVIDRVAAQLTAFTANRYR